MAFDSFKFSLELFDFIFQFFRCFHGLIVGRSGLVL